MATLFGPYAFANQSTGDVDEFLYTDPLATDATLPQSPNTGRRWCWDSDDTTSNNVGPTSGAGGDPEGYLYTEASSPAAFDDVFYLEFDNDVDCSSYTNVTIKWKTNQRGDNNNATCQLQSNENGAGWVNRGSQFGGSGDSDKVASSGTQIWSQRSVDISALGVSNATTRVRLVVTFPSSGTSWHNDYGIDDFEITGDLAADDLLADDVESSSETAAPTLEIAGRARVSWANLLLETELSAHVLLAEDVETASETSEPAAGEINNPLAEDIESASEADAPALGQEHALLKDSDFESTSEVTTSTIGQTHNLLADDVESGTETGTPSIGQVHNILADDAETDSEVSGTFLGQEHGLLADDAEAPSEVGTPAMGQEHALLADDVESASETTAPEVSIAVRVQVSWLEMEVEVPFSYNLLAEDVETATEVSVPALVENVDDLLADDVETTSEIDTPAVGQAHALLAEDVETTSEVTEPAIAQISVLNALDVEADSELDTPAVGQEHALLIEDSLESASEISAVDIGQEHALLAEDVETASEVTNPTVTEIYNFVAVDLECLTEVSVPVYYETATALPQAFIVDCALSLVNVWGVTDSDQNLDCNPVPDTQTPNFVEIDTSQTLGCSPADSSQASGWSDTVTTQTAVYNRTDT